MDLVEAASFTGYAAAVTANQSMAAVIAVVAVAFGLMVGTTLAGTRA